MNIIGRQVSWEFRDRIPDVRAAFTERINKLEDKSLVYSEDIDKTMNDDFWVEKFLEWHRGNVVKAADGLVFSLKFQKSYRVRDLRDCDFPSEYFSTGSFFEYEPDRLGRKTVYIRMKYGPACKETREIGFQWMLFKHFKLQEECGEKGYIGINDFTGMTMKNLDLKAMPKAMEIMEAFPLASQLAVGVNLPTAIRMILNTFLYALPVDQRKAILLINPQQVQEVVAVENLPDYLGGTCTRRYSGQEMIPKGCMPLRDILFGAVAAKKDFNQNGHSIENAISTEVVKRMEKSPLLWPDDLDYKGAQSALSYFETILPLNA